MDCRSGKHGHVTPQLAYIEVKRTTNRHHHRLEGRKVVYKCHWCSLWHVTRDEEGESFRKQYRSRQAPRFDWREWA